MKFCLCVFYLG